MVSGRLGVSASAWLSAVAVLALGLAIVGLPWLAIREDLSGGAQAGGTAGSDEFPPARTTPGGVRANRPGTLLLFPVPQAARPVLASAPAFAAPAPDPGSVLALEKSLRSLSYLVGAEDGVMDPSTGFGITAFQKVEGLPRTGVPDEPTLARLSSAQRPEPKYRTPPDHLEVDIARQVVFVVKGGQVAETLPTSTGNGKTFYSQGRRSRAVTPNGQFAITYKRNGWRRSPLGLLYRPAYFNDGIAFHGAKSVPATPASHGCVRLPMPFADKFAEQDSPPGMVVYVYGNPGQPDPAPVAAAGVPVGAPPPVDAAYPSGAPAPAPPPAPPPGPSSLLPGLLGSRS